MKRKNKNIVKAGLLSAALMLGTGYAVINNRTLTATGTVPIAEKELDIKFEALGIEGANISTDKYSVTFEFDEINEDDYNDVFIVVMKNYETDLSASVSSSYYVFDENDNEVSDLTISFSLIEGNTSRINPGEEVTLECTINWNSILVSQYETLTITLLFEFAPVLD